MKSSTTNNLAEVISSVAPKLGMTDKTKPLLDTKLVFAKMLLATQPNKTI
ncbi:MAG: hypothetical protein MTP17_03365 [Candidatus Midichloria sp.]|nr:MAG: hypothetical protein MTP17_03365 [Candidatus Midichloria sp.]